MERLSELLNIGENAEARLCKKGEILLKQGDLSSHSFFVKKGLLKSYIIDEKGKEHIFLFAAEGWIIADIDSQEFDHPAELFIECIEDSEVIIFDRKNFANSRLTPNQLKLNTDLMARRIAVLQKRVLMLMSSSAQERYKRFLETYPALPNRVPQRMIASYLGITPEALSKIRGKIARSK